MTSRRLICELPWMEASKRHKYDYVWRLARFYLYGGVVTVDKGVGDPVVGVTLPTEAQQSHSHRAYARWCWRRGVDPLGLLDVDPPEVVHRTRKRSWLIYCKQDKNGIRVAGARYRDGKPTTANVPGSHFPPELAAVLELKDGRLTGWTTIINLVHDLMKFDHPDLRVLTSFLTARTCRLIVRVPETTSHEVGTDRIKAAAWKRLSGR